MIEEQSSDQTAATRDWAAEATDTVVNVVDTVRANTAGRAEMLAKAIVYGLLAGLLGLAVLVLLLIGLFRVADAYLPPADSSWSAWLLFGVVFTIAGLVVWNRRPSLD